jgi:hypothetical protein
MAFLTFSMAIMKKCLVSDCHKLNADRGTRQDLLKGDPGAIGEVFSLNLTAEVRKYFYRTVGLRKRMCKAFGP